MLVIIILQLKVVDNNTMEKLMVVILQLEIMGNNPVEKNLIDPSIKS